MNILIIGSKDQADIIKGKITEDHKILFTGVLSEPNLEKADVVFDFTKDEVQENLEEYVNYPKMVVFLNSVIFSLAQQAIYQGNVECSLFGFNGHPTFVERELMEISMYNKEEKYFVQNVMNMLSLDFQLVEDRIGMISPRIVSMIINEAYFTVMEGTASKEAIDLGMKLGTNYPMGPFEWAQKWGVSHVYEVLEALYEDTKEERYKICPLLKKEYLKGMV